MKQAQQLRPQLDEEQRPKPGDEHDAPPSVADPHPETGDQ
jgi:hypothetical protein